MKPAPAQYEVLRDGTRVLSFSDEPGVLMSTGIRPRGFDPPAHPFLNAQALDAGFEQALAAILSRAKSTQDFISLLEGEGFQVSRLAP